MKKITMLLILDGFGFSEEKTGNAIAQAKMPTWKKLFNKYPHKLLAASGKAVGLPEGFMGNSEVGHLCIGAGRVIKTVLSKFHDQIDDGSFFKNKLLCEKFSELKNSGKSLHLIGLLSDAGVHAHEKHFYATIKLAKQIGIKNVYIHPFLDGRDVPPKSALEFLGRLQDVCDREKLGKIATLHGRFYGMDRDNNWDRVQKSYDVLCSQEGQEKYWGDVVKDSYAQNITDEFLIPTVVDPEGTIRKGDGVLFLNFRPDRARQLAELLSKQPLLFFVTTTRYGKEFRQDVLFEDEKISHTLLDEISAQNDIPLFIIAETEKYAHVTYFFRGKVEVELPNETRILIPSLKVATYVDVPEMSAKEITQEIVRALDDYQFFLVNFANCDMVAHSGDIDATVKACECIDRQLEILYKEVVEKRGGTIFVTGDHGNAEEMIDMATGQVRTAHTTNPVPFVVLGDKIDLSDMYGLADIAPLILTHMGLVVPDEMRKKP